MTSTDHTRIALATALQIAVVRARQHVDALTKLRQTEADPTRAERIDFDIVDTQHDAEVLAKLARSYGGTS